MKIGKLGVSRFGKSEVLADRQSTLSLIAISIHVCRLCYFFGQSLIASQIIYHDPRTRRDHGATLNGPAENIRPKHDRYFSHGRARPNAREMYAHTSFPGAHELRRPPRVRPAPNGSAAVGARVRLALLASRNTVYFHT